MPSSNKGVLVPFEDRIKMRYLRWTGKTLDQIVGAFNARFGAFVVRREVGDITPQQTVPPNPFVIIGREAIEKSAVPELEGMDDLYEQLATVTAANETSDDKSKQEVDRKAVKETLDLAPQRTPRSHAELPASTVFSASEQNDFPPDPMASIKYADLLGMSDEEFLSFVSLAVDFGCKSIGDFLQNHIRPLLVWWKKVQWRMGENFTPDDLERIMDAAVAQADEYRALRSSKNWKNVSLGSASFLFKA
jgi:hypothetical protein